MKSASSFRLKPSPQAARWAWGIGASVVLLDVVILASLGRENRAIFAIIPGTLLVIGIFVGIARSLSQTRFEISSQGLAIRGDWFFRRRIPQELLEVAQARLVNLTLEPALRPQWKIKGTGLPGYNAGWFKLHNGEKALLFLTDQTDALHVPTRDGYALLISAADNAALLSALQKM